MRNGGRDVQDGMLARTSSECRGICKKGLYEFKDAPPYLQGNKSILTGYRLHYSNTEVFFSIFENHNGILLHLFPAKSDYLIY